MAAYLKRKTALSGPYIGSQMLFEILGRLPFLGYYGGLHGGHGCRCAGSDPEPGQGTDRRPDGPETGRRSLIWAPSGAFSLFARGHARSVEQEAPEPREAGFWDHPT